MKETTKKSETRTDQTELANIKETFSKQIPNVRESGIREKNVIIYQVKECLGKDGATRKKSVTEYM